MLGNSVVSTGTGTQAAHGGKTSSKLHASTSHGDGQAAYATATEGYDYDEDEQHDDHEDHEDEENYACEDDDECYDDGQEDTEARNNEDDLQRYML